MSKFKIESGAQLLARLVKKPNVLNFYPALFNSDTFVNGGVVEVVSNMNTSDLLIDIITDTLLSNKFSENLTDVIVYNTAGKINFKSVLNSLTTKLKSEVNFLANSEHQSGQLELNKLLHRILNHLFLLDVYDASQLYVTLHNLDNILAQHPNTSLIVCDSITAFYWSEQGLKITQMDLYLKNLLRIIEKVSKDYKVLFFYSRPEYFTSKKEHADFETCEVTNGINIKIYLQICFNQKDYQVEVRTVDSYYKKYFSIVDKLLKWH